MLGLGSHIQPANIKSLITSQSFYHDATGDAVNLGDIQSILRGSFTIGYWLKYDSELPSGHTISGQTGVDANTTIYQGILSTGNWYFWFKVDNSVSQILTSSGFSGTDPGDWFHLGYRVEGNYSGGNSRLSVYINGTLLTSHSGTPWTKHQALNTNGKGFWVGGFNGISGHQFGLLGHLADISVHNIALSDDSMAAVGNPSGGKPLDLTSNNGGYQGANNLQIYLRFNKDAELINEGSLGGTYTTEGNPVATSLVHPNI